MTLSLNPTIQFRSFFWSLEYFMQKKFESNQVNNLCKQFGLDIYVLYQKVVTIAQGQKCIMSSFPLITSVTSVFLHHNIFQGNCVWNGWDSVGKHVEVTLIAILFKIPVVLLNQPFVSIRKAKRRNGCVVEFLDFIFCGLQPI